MSKAYLLPLILLLVLSVLSAPAAAEEGDEMPIPKFKEVSVHDPSVIRAEDGTFYIYGSHMAAAKSTDLMQWEMFFGGHHHHYHRYHCHRLGRGLLPGTLLGLFVSRANQNRTEEY